MIHELIKNKKANIDMGLLKESVRKILLPGKSTAITAGEIARRIAYEFAIPIESYNSRYGYDRDKLEDAFGGSSYSKIRCVCKQLLEIDLIPVLSCNRGFYIGENQADLKEYQNNIWSRIKGMERILLALHKIREDWNTEKTLFDERK